MNVDASTYEVDWGSFTWYENPTSLENTFNLANLDDASFEEIHHAWLDYHVIYVRRQEMTPEDHLAFARRWGEIHIHPFNAPMDGYPEILQLLKTEDSRRNNGNLWHSDQMYTAQPAKATILIAREMPPFGGDTMFTNQYLAYETLSDGMKEMAGKLKGVNDGFKVWVKDFHVFDLRFGLCAQKSSQGEILM